MTTAKDLIRDYGEECIRLTNNYKDTDWVNDQKDDALNELMEDIKKMLNYQFE